MINPILTTTYAAWSTTISLLWLHDAPNPLHPCIGWPLSLSALYGVKQLLIKSQTRRNDIVVITQDHRQTSPQGPFVRPKSIPLLNG